MASRRRNVPGVLLLRGLGSSDDDRYPLDAHEAETIGPAFRSLVSYAVDPDNAAIAHERDGQVVAGWSRDGAMRLAQVLPPGLSTLAGAIRDRHHRSPEQGASSPAHVRSIRPRPAPTRSDAGAAGRGAPDRRTS